MARTQLGRALRLVVAGHLDTVPANGNATPRVDGDVLWGLGSADMKGGLAVMLELAAAVPDPAVDVTWVFYAGEEVAAEHNGLGHLFAQRPDLVAGDAALLGEPTGAALEVGCQGIDAARGHTAPAPGPTRPGPGWGATPSTAPAGCWPRSTTTRPAGR